MATAAPTAGATGKAAVAEGSTAAGGATGRLWSPPHVPLPVHHKCMRWSEGASARRTSVRASDGVRETAAVAAFALASVVAALMVIGCGGSSIVVVVVVIATAAGIAAVVRGRRLPLDLLEEGIVQALHEVSVLDVTAQVLGLLVADGALAVFRRLGELGQNLGALLILAQLAFPPLARAVPVVRCRAVLGARAGGSVALAAATGRALARALVGGAF